MGINANSAQTLADGLRVFNGSLNGTLDGRNYSNEYNEEARMMELDAEADAAEVARQAEKQASALREERELERGKQNTRWGRSGLAMNGSKQLVRDATRQRDKEDEEDVLFEGELKEQDVLDRGLRDANRYRIRRGLKPSTLSLGSTIYKYKG
ncbi:hypothetical protein [Pseudodesulfovibrio sp. zrk46]|uniref:hypothetical protein n=1 Tax=Pseudodesulfovibrio sp. zrk46 TaxID=2725288 RepID=UPI00144A17C1|nr:hypothetical protein [Pseudodesulfovibrio sp. zrk46]QJB56176.1 hypothetical protein HFN16_07010 [Pseudodesulfovibrio sp. zrk46]